jgi:hypothetical protein
MSMFKRSEETITAPDNLLAILTELHASACELRRLVSDARRKKVWYEVIRKKPFIFRVRSTKHKQVGNLLL